VFPQVPQFASSVCTALQTPEQHVSPTAHSIPQSPQFNSSSYVALQKPLQHVPLQELPHVPQLLRSVAVFLQTPEQQV
jgi:hypothetical protein